MRHPTTWRKVISEAMQEAGDSWDNLESMTLSDAELNKVFDCGYGGAEGLPFTLWTKERVYFPAVYDGSEWVASVSRNPDGKPTNHVGGE